MGSKEEDGTNDGSPVSLFIMAQKVEAHCSTAFTEDPRFWGYMMQPSISNFPLGMRQSALHPTLGGEGGPLSKRWRKSIQIT